MDGRVLVLAIPSAAILGALVYHSLKALPRTRALAFWASAAAYGLLRGIAVHLVTDQGLGASFPYVIRHPLLSVAGVSLQEIAGWAIVTYLGWWLGYRFARSLHGGLPIAGASRLLRNFPHSRASGTATERGRRAGAGGFGAGGPEGSDRDRALARAHDAEVRDAPLFPQILWACLFLGAISWAVESAAVAAGWWYWTLPARSALLINVPFIGLVDWFFAGIDFLLPFAVISSGALRRSRMWLLTVGLFPIHFASHAFTGRPGDLLPIPFFHLVHWAMLGLTVWLALRSTLEDPAFECEDRRSGWIPLLSAAVMLADLALVETFWVRRPSLLPSVLPAAVVLVFTTAPAAALAAGLAALVLGLFHLPLILAAVPGAAAVLLRWAGTEAQGVAGEKPGLVRSKKRMAPERHSKPRTQAAPPVRWRAPIVLAVMAMTAFGIHHHGARREQKMKSRLDAALASRDRGDLEGTVLTLRSLIEEFPNSHAARALLGEIYYKTDRLDDARAQFAAAVDIKRDFMMGRRYLAVIELQKGDRAGALADARTGLELEPDDLELRYVEARASGSETRPVWRRAEAAGPAAIESLASLALESGDAANAANGLDRAIAQWPSRSALYAARVRVALSSNDIESARRVTAAWRARFPDDPQARSLAARLGMPE